MNSWIPINPSNDQFIIFYLICIHIGLIFLFLTILDVFFVRNIFTIELYNKYIEKLPLLSENRKAKIKNFVGKIKIIRNKSFDLILFNLCLLGIGITVFEIVCIYLWLAYVI